MRLHERITNATAMRLHERITNATARLSINSYDIVSITDLLHVRANYSAFYGYNLSNCLMVKYTKCFVAHYCFVCNNGFVVEYEEDEMCPINPHDIYNIYNIMVLYGVMGYKQNDIAIALNTSVSTIGNRIKIIKQILEVSDIDDLDPEDAIKIKYDRTHLRLSDLSNRLQAIIDKYERRKNDGKNVNND